MQKRFIAFVLSTAALLSCCLAVFAEAINEHDEIYESENEDYSAVMPEPDQIPADIVYDEYVTDQEPLSDTDENENTAENTEQYMSESAYEEPPRENPLSDEEVINDESQTDSDIMDNILGISEEETVTAPAQEPYENVLNDGKIELFDESSSAPVPTPYITVSNVIGGKNVTLYKMGSQKNEVYYTLDRSDPAVNGKLSSGVIELREKGRYIIKAVCVTPDGEVSETAQQEVILQRLGGEPEITELTVYDSGRRSNETRIKISGDSTNIFYTDDGAEPDLNSKLYYGGEIKVTKIPFTIKAFLAEEGKAAGSIAQHTVYSASGIVNDGVAWTIDRRSTLTISGNGAMVSDDSVLWDGLAESVSSIVIGSGITSICDNAFRHCKNADYIKIGRNVTKIGSNICSVDTAVEYSGSFISWLNATQGSYYGNHTVHCTSGIVPGGSFASGAGWKLTPDGVFTVSGAGDMDDYSNTAKTPWYQYREYIKTVKLSSGITSVGSFAFAECSNLREVFISDSLRQIKASAFVSSGGISDIYFDGAADKWIDIDVWSGNSSIERSSIHYLRAGFGDIEIKGISSYGGNVTAVLVNKSDSPFYFTALCAAAADGRIVSVTRREIDIGSNSEYVCVFEKAAEKGNVFSVFAWGGIGAMQPLCTSTSR